MNETEKKSGNAKDIVIIVLVIALIVGLIFSFVSVGNVRKDADAKVNDLKAQLDSAIAQINGKLDEGSSITMEQVKDEIADAIADIQFPEHTDKATVSQLIADAIAKIKFPESVNKDTVEDLIADAIAGIEIEEGISVETIQQLIADAIAAIEFPETLSPEEIEKIVADAVADLEAKLEDKIDDCVTDAEMKAAIAAAIKKLPAGGLTEAQVKKIVNDILAKFEVECPCDHMTKEEIEDIVKDVIESMGGNEEPEVPVEPEIPESTVQVDAESSLDAALENEDVSDIVLENDITLTKPLIIGRDVTIDLNGYRLKTVANVEYPVASTMEILDGCKVAFKNGLILDVATKLDGGFDFIRVRKGAELNLDKVTVSITLSPEVKWNNTKDRWQTNSAEHRIIVIASGAAVNLNKSNVDVVSPKVQNINNYVRYRFAITGVYFARNAASSKFVMNGGSFSIKITDPNAANKLIDYTDVLTFIKSERVTNDVANATNTAEIKGNADITIGGPNSEGKVVTDNNFFWLGTGYLNGDTIGSGLKTITLAAGTNFNMNGFAYTVKSANVLDVESKLQSYGANGSILSIYDVTELKYHFVCTNLGYSCTYEADLTLAEVAEYTKCPHCGTGKLVLEEN